jgi:hypothetical protein
MPDNDWKSLGWAAGIEIVLVILILINRKPLGDIILLALMGAVAIGTALVLFQGTSEKRRERGWVRAKNAARWERRTATSRGSTRVYLTKVASYDGLTQDFGPTERVGSAISTDDPEWHLTVLAREAQADERLFVLNRLNRQY